MEKSVCVNMELKNVFYYSWFLVLMILSFYSALVEPAKMANEEMSQSQRENGVYNTKGMEYAKLDKDCGNFLDPCGGKDDPPCCPPDFCGDSNLCVNSTLI